MITLTTIRKQALALEGVEQRPHFEKISFRVNNKIFITVDTKAKVSVLKLNKIDQSVFSEYDPSAIYPVTGAWGRKGWTMFEMNKVRKDLFSDALITAYCNVAPVKYSLKYRIQ
jgi:hypothetical protein